MSYCLKCKKKTKSKNISYVKSKKYSGYTKRYMFGVWLKKRVNSSPNTNKRGGDRQKLSGSKFTTTGIPGELYLPGILSVVKEQI